MEGSVVHWYSSAPVCIGMNGKVYGPQKEREHTCFLDPESSSVVDGILVVVDGSVVPDQVEVFLKVVKGVVLVGIQLLLHRRKVHGALDDIKVVRHLEEERKGEGERERDQLVTLTDGMWFE